jgi:hypothetical protein
MQLPYDHNHDSPCHRFCDYTDVSNKPIIFRRKCYGVVRICHAGLLKSFPTHYQRELKKYNNNNNPFLINSEPIQIDG